jgi:hypothetical protein
MTLPENNMCNMSLRMAVGRKEFCSEFTMKTITTINSTVVPLHDMSIELLRPLSNDEEPFVYLGRKEFFSEFRTN